MKVSIFDFLDYYKGVLEKFLEKLNSSNPPLLKQEVIEKRVIEILLTRDALEKVLSNRIKPSTFGIL
ncbi:MAG: hypothetical protein F6K18_11315 [Okeania sp. SIO2C2]|uniref:hypothetical protein n=1 Tax=Okeania sp. SIO2C2 TaxID=2607787 RepID=UPI0013BA87AA|nr:hypothetical protein [Okeania sp. SIO2C2]NEP87367.1 hypothetical protein [Okeania sp. SIO2C2]